jgi:hypothetical protein
VTNPTAINFTRPFLNLRVPLPLAPNGRTEGKILGQDSILRFRSGLNNFADLSITGGTNIVAGNIPQGEMSCLRYFGEGVAHFGCLTSSKQHPPDPQPPGTLATVIVRPQPELYTLLTPGGPPLVVDIINRECQMADLQGHNIPSWQCGDARVTIRHP